MFIRTLKFVTGYLCQYPDMHWSCSKERQSADYEIPGLMQCMSLCIIWAGLCICIHCRSESFHWSSSSLWKKLHLSVPLTHTHSYIHILTAYLAHDLLYGAVSQCFQNKQMSRWSSALAFRNPHLISVDLQDIARSKAHVYPHILTAVPFRRSSCRGK